MTGGGFSAGRFDPARPVRVPSIRGHLRNWFRLMNQEGESELFGSTDKAGKVYVDVKDVSSPVPLQKEYRLASPEYYALFSVLNRKTQETIPFTDAIALCCCAKNFALLPPTPFITKNIAKTVASTISVSCQLLTNIITRHTVIVVNELIICGRLWLMSISKVSVSLV